MIFNRAGKIRIWCVSEKRAEFTFREEHSLFKRAQPKYKAREGESGYFKFGLKVQGLKEKLRQHQVLLNPSRKSSYVCVFCFIKKLRVVGQRKDSSKEVLRRKDNTKYF